MSIRIGDVAYIDGMPPVCVSNAQQYPLFYEATHVESKNTLDDLICARPGGIVWVRSPDNVWKSVNDISWMGG